jgi:hypothetical protein
VLVLVLAASALSSVVLISAAGRSSAASGAPVSITAAPRIPSGAKAIGAVSGATTQTGALVLRPRDEAALKQFIGEVSDSRSASFHRYLAPGAFASRFGPTQATIEAVKSQLAGDGLRVTNVASDGLIVSFTGSASQVERAFQTRLARYRLADGTVGQATTTSVAVPSSIAGAVAAVVGLNDLVRMRPHSLVHAPASARGVRPAARAGSLAHPAGSPSACANAQHAAQQFGGLTDDQIANAYGAFGLYGAGDRAAGQHIAVFELEPFAPSDIKTFDTCYFGETAAAQMAERLHTIPVDGGQPTGQGSGEAILDIEDVSAIAPGATIDVYESPNNTFGVLDQYAAIVNNDTDKVVTSSWGLCEQAVQLGAPGTQQAESFLFEQAAAQGQSVFSAAGDTGSDDCNAFRAPVPPAGQNPLSVDDPSSQPYAVAVGGTTIDNAATQPPQEHVWNDGAQWGAAGGGISMSWAMPSWQQGSRVPGIVLPGSSDYAQANSVESRFEYPPGFCQAYLAGASSSTLCRTLPDVSAQADEFTGAVTIFSTEFENPETPDGWITTGGTSSSAPIWAALLAVANASPTCAANPATASGVGFVSPLLYAVASNPAAYRASFNDITAGNNDNYGLDNGLVFPARTGYDLASGLGSPQLTGAGGKAGLAFYLCSLAARASRPAVTHLSPSLLSTSGGTVTITGSGFKSSASGGVAGIQVGTWQIPSAKFKVNTATSIAATFPPASDTLPPGSPAPQDGAGPANVIVTLKDGESSSAGPASTLQYVDKTSSSPVPSVTGVSPSGGPETSPTPVTILGSGFTGATKVAFGGVPATSFAVKSPFEISATPAPYSGSTNCAPSVPGQTPASDVCQVQVQVTNAHGTSATGQILPPYEGPVLELTPMGVPAPPPGCNCEVVPAPSEFDYVPAPSVTSISTSTASPGSLASELGGTLITVTGKGFDPLTFDWADFGDPTLASSMSTAVHFLSGTQMQIVAPASLAPGQEPTIEPTTLPFSVKTLAGQSPASPVTYAGEPLVTSALNTATHRNGGPDTGQTPIAIGGEGFKQAIGPLLFADTRSPFSTGTQYSYTVNSDTSISAQTVSQNPALVDVLACSVTGCRHNPPSDYFYLYPPGNPKVVSIKPASGPSAGGTKVAISGQNLGCVTGVFFGKVAAVKFSDAEALLDCGSTSLIEATAPPHPTGKVTVTVSTVESDFSGSGPSKSSATFTYTQ